MSEVIPSASSPAPSSPAAAAPAPASSLIAASTAPVAPSSPGSSSPGAAAATAQPSAFSIYAEGGLHPDLAKLVAGDEFKGARSVLQKYAKAEDPNKALMLGLSNLNYLASQKGLEPLPADAPDAVKAEFEQKLRKITGAPEKPEDYGFKRPEGVPENMFSEEYANEVSKILHKHSASPQLAKDLLAFDATFGQQKLESTKQSVVQAARAELSRVYGNKLDSALMDAERGIDIASGLTNIPADSLRQSATNNPMMIQLLAAIKTATAEDTRADGQPAGSSRSYIEQADAIMTDPSNPYHGDWKSGDTARQGRASAERQRLIKLHLATGR